MLKAKNNILPLQDFSADTQSTWSGDFFFIQAADTQLGLMYNFGGKSRCGVNQSEGLVFSKIFVLLPPFHGLSVHLVN